MSAAGWSRLTEPTDSPAQCGIAAIEAPRVRPQESNRVISEGRLGVDVVAELTARGHVVDRLPDFSMAFGGAQGIMVDPDNGTFTGGADPRRDGYAIGW